MIILKKYHQSITRFTYYNITLSHYNPFLSQRVCKIFILLLLRSNANNFFLCNRIGISGTQTTSKVHGIGKKARDQLFYTSVAGVLTTDKFDWKKCFKLTTNVNIVLYIKRKMMVHRQHRAMTKSFGCFTQFSWLSTTLFCSKQKAQCWWWYVFKVIECKRQPKGGCTHLTILDDKAHEQCFVNTWWQGLP